ncbi:MAG: single-stranded DNA-binding protein [Candidatus Gracilibacteria bacterium]|nr:single-stranded DNA-binding protein [Candidatus Gracilibacteria bacterium]
MNSLNKVQLIGNITADPEVRQTPNGQYVANFSLATNRVWKDASGAKQEQSEFHNVVVWGKLAEIVEQYVKKGKKIYVEGRLQTRSWEDQTGAKKYKTEIVADNVILLGTPGGKDESSDFSMDYSSNESSPSKARKSSPKQEEEINIEDIPF